jgi:phosphatidylserine/phosphatidylglycerophosphate/cardiolipin synthase-like enzyme
VRVLLDASQTEDVKTMYGFFKKNQIEVKRISAPKNGIMHNKVAVFDTKTALTGSYNWTGSAERYNYENAVILDDQQAVFDYKQEFENLWGKASDNSYSAVPKRAKKGRKTSKAGIND